GPESPAAEDDVRDAAEHRRLALEASGLGTWSWVAEGNRFTADARCRAIGDYALTGPLGFEEAAGRIHPDDRARVEAALRSAIAPDGDGGDTQEFRFVHRDGTGRGGDSRAHTLFIQKDGRRRAERIVGVTLDVTHLRATEHALHSREGRCRVVIEASPIGFTMLRAIRQEGRVVDFAWLHLNPAAGRLLGRDPAELVGRTISETRGGGGNSGG